MKYRQPDKQRAESLLIAAKREIDFTRTLPISEQSASTIVRNVFQSYLMVGEALLIADGKEADDHAESIQVLMKLPAQTKRPLGAIDNLRRVRNNANYRGYMPSVAEAKDALSLAEDFPEVISAAKTKIESR